MEEMEAEEEEEEECLLNLQEHPRIIISILKKTIHQLYLLQNQYETIFKNAPIEEVKEPLNIRFNKDNYKDDGIFYRATGEPYAVAVERLKFDKLSGAKNYLIRMFENCVKELREYQTTSGIVQEVTNETERNLEEKEFIRESCENILILDRLKQQINYTNGKYKKIKSTIIDHQLDVSRIG